MNVLIVGKGGREHALALKISQSPLLTKTFIAPGNPGTEKVHKTSNVDIEINDIEGLKDFAKKEKIVLTVVGPEAPIALGISDIFQKENLQILAPSMQDALLEASKIHGKKIMEKKKIPTASYSMFFDYNLALNYINDIDFPVVIKADGLAQGKGAYICDVLEDAKRVLEDIMVRKIYGDAGRRVLIEEFLKGEEYSFHALYDVNKDVKVFLPSKDYKDFSKTDKRKTGGMGAYAPALNDRANLITEVTNTVIMPAVSGISASNGAFIYPGIIITPNGSQVLEYNMRFGDPEAQALLPLMKTDILEVFLACVKGKLSEITIEWHRNLHVVCVVLVSDGYPEEYDVGFPISGIFNARKIKGVKIFHAGTVYKDKKLVTNGGRVLNVTATGKTLKEARWLAYKGVEEIHFEGMQYRDDIGLELSPYQRT